MPKSALVWLDSSTAKIFEFAGDAVERRTYHRRELEPVRRHSQVSDRDVDAFFHQVAEHLYAAGDFMLLGPGETKRQFLHHLEHHHHRALARHCVTVESAGHPSDRQLVAYGRDYFARHPLPG